MNIQVAPGHDAGQELTKLLQESFAGHALFPVVDSANACSLQIQVPNPQWTTERRSIMFFFCNQNLHLEAQVKLLGLSDSLPQFTTTLVADTSLDVGYCGLFERSAKPISALERLRSEKALYLILAEQLKSRFRLLFPE